MGKAVTVLFIVWLVSLSNGNHLRHRDDDRYYHPELYLDVRDPAYYLQYRNQLAYDQAALLRLQYQVPNYPLYNPVLPIALPPTTTTTTTTTPPPSPISPITSLTPADDQAAAAIGVKVPPDSCVMTWDQFQQNIPGRNWISLYGIDDDENLNPGIAYKFHGLWTVTNDTTIRRRGSLWDNVTKKCLFADGMFSRETGTGRAIFRNAGGNIFAAVNRRDYFVSSDPSNYFIFYICYDSDKIRDGRCITSEILFMVRDQRPQPTDGNGIPTGELTLNDIAWGKLEADLKNCLGQEFVDSTDPQVIWTWLNPGELRSFPKTEDLGRVAGKGTFGHFTSIREMTS